MNLFVRNEFYFKEDYVSSNLKLSENDCSVMSDMKVNDSWEFLSSNIKHVVSETVPLIKPKHVS